MSFVLGSFSPSLAVTFLYCFSFVKNGDQDAMDKEEIDPSAPTSNDILSAHVTKDNEPTK